MPPPHRRRRLLRVAAEVAVAEERQVREAREKFQNQLEKSGMRPADAERKSRETVVRWDRQANNRGR